MEKEADCCWSTLEFLFCGVGIVCGLQLFQGRRVSDGGILALSILVLCKTMVLSKVDKVPISL